MKLFKKANDLIDKINEVNNGRESQRIGQDSMNQVLILKDTINEVMTKVG